VPRAHRGQHETRAGFREHGVVHPQRAVVLVGLRQVGGRMAPGGEQPARQPRGRGAAQDFSRPFFEPPDARDSPEEGLLSPEEGLLSRDFSCFAFSL